MPPTTHGHDGLYNHSTMEQYQKIAKDYKDLVKQDMRYVVLAGGITGRRSVGSSGLYSTSRWYKNNIIKGSDIGEDWEIARLLYHSSIRPLEVKMSRAQISDALQYSMDHVQGRYTDGNASHQQMVADTVSPPEELEPVTPEHLNVDPGDLEDYWNNAVTQADASKSATPEQRIAFMREQVQLSRDTDRNKKSVSAPAPKRRATAAKSKSPEEEENIEDVE